MDILEYLLPFIFVIIFMISKIFGKKEEDEDSTPTFTSEESPNQGPPPLVDIRQEILRKIQERQREETPVTSQGPPPFTHKEEPNFFQEAPKQIDYQSQIAENQRKAEESKKRAQAIRAQQRATKKAAQPKKDYYAKTVKISQSEMIQELLKNPYAARQAFLSYEILGTPVALRNQGAMQVSWKQ